MDVKAIQRILMRKCPQLARSRSDSALDNLVQRLHQPILEWTNKLAMSATDCVTIGLSAVQGCGKTTMCQLLQTLFAESGKKCIVISLDDFYLEHSQQLQLAKRNEKNSLLQYRGNPGTHDMELLMSFIRHCKRRGSQEIAIPAFDKSRHRGRGDRVPICDWKKTRGPIDILIIEGWCLGFQTLPSCRLPRYEYGSEDLVPINNALITFDELYHELDGLALIRAADLNWVYRWREEQEADARNAHNEAMSKEQVIDFVDRYMPTYRLYLPEIYKIADVSTTKRSHATSILHQIPRIVIDVDSDRTPISSFSYPASNPI